MALGVAIISLISSLSNQLDNQFIKNIKGVDMVIKAIASLNQEIQEKISYIVVGTGEAESYLKDLAAELKVKVTFTGEVSELEKWSFLSLCDIFIMPARSIDGDFEGFGIVYLEANIYGKPVIAGRSGGVSDAVLHNESGLLVPKVFFTVKMAHCVPDEVNLTVGF